MPDPKEPPAEEQPPEQPPTGEPPPFDPQLDLIGDAERAQGPPPPKR
jgi:hypothetical protein